MSKKLIEVIEQDANTVILELDRRVLSVIHSALNDAISANDDWLMRDVQAMTMLVRDRLPYGNGTSMADLSRAFAAERS